MRILSSKLHDLYQEYNKQWYGWYRPDKVDNFVKHKFVTAKEANYIKNIIPILNEVYPKEWDIQLMPFVNYKVAAQVRISGAPEVNKTMNSRSAVFAIHPVIVIHFPEHNVTNGKIVHTIRDLYFYIPLYENLGEITVSKDFYGVRTSFTQFEVNNGYSFSHLHSNSAEDFLSARPKRFCLGTSEMSQIPLIINSSPEQYNYFKLLLLQAKEYVKWESIDGGPYIRLSNIYSEGETLYEPTTKTVITIGKNIYDKLMEKLIAGQYVLPLVVNRYYIMLNPNDDFLRILKEIAIELDVEDELLVLRSEAGEYYSNRNTSVRELDMNSARSLLFKGEFRKVNILPSEEVEVEVIKYLHPKITQNVISRINKQLKERTVENYISQRFQSTSVH